MKHVPDPDPLETNFDGTPYDGGIRQAELEIDGGTIQIAVGGSNDRNEVKVHSTDFPLPQCLWTAVYWCRAQGIQEAAIRTISETAELPPYQLNGLYRMVDFELWEDERL